MIDKGGISTEAFKEYLSLVPGPIQVDGRILESMSRQVLTHLNEGWSPFYLDVCGKMKKIAGTSGDCYLMCSSGTGGVEAAVVSAVAPGEKLLVLTNGLFGDRFAEIAEAYRLEVEILRFPYREPVDPERLRERLAQGVGNIAAVSAVYSESQNGMLNPVKELAAVCHAFDLPLLVDAVSAMGGVEFRMDDWGVDVAVAGMQKCLGGVVGVACVFVNDRAWRYFTHKNAMGYYFNLNIWRENMHAYENDPPSRPHAHPCSMSESLIFGVDAACDLILEEGLENRWERHRELCRFYVKGLEELGFAMYLPEDCACPTVVSVYPHPKLGVEEMAGRLREEHGILVGCGIADQKTKLWRIGNMAGQACREKADRLLEALRAVLESA